MKSLSVDNEEYLTAVHRSHPQPRQQQKAPLNEFYYLTFCIKIIFVCRMLVNVGPAESAHSSQPLELFFHFFLFLAQNVWENCEISRCLCASLFIPSSLRRWSEHETEYPGTTKRETKIKWQICADKWTSLLVLRLLLSLLCLRQLRTDYIFILFSSLGFFLLRSNRNGKTQKSKIRKTNQDDSRKK